MPISTDAVVVALPDVDGSEVPLLDEVVDDLVVVVEDPAPPGGPAVELQPTSPRVAAATAAAAIRNAGILARTVLIPPGIRLWWLTIDGVVDEGLG